MSEAKFGATGRRKEAVAHAVIKVGGGSLMINEHTAKEYLRRDTLVELVTSPMRETETMGKLDVDCKVSGGGLSGQAGAVLLAVSRAIAKLDPDLRSTLKRSGFLTRDAREVERKKYGRPKARKRFQYSKR